MRARLVLLSAALAVFAACGGDEDASPAPTSASTDATPSAPPTASTTLAPPTTALPTAPVTTAPATTAPPPTTTATAGPAPDPVATFAEIGVADNPTDLAWRAGDPGLYVVEQRGTIVRLADGTSTTVLDGTTLTDAGGERGFLGLAFAPSGDVAYVNYTDLEGTTTISEYPVAPDGRFLDGDEARVLFTIEQPYSNHNGGDLVFGPDGFLYIGMGDGGSGDDPERRALDLTTPLGKVLRVDPTPSGQEPYTVPADNPFVATAGADPRIWSTGLRNPWRLSFDRLTGDLWIGDVGQDEIEEMDVASATDGVDAGKGLSFGWSAYEGDARFNDDQPAEGHVAPFLTYTHTDTGGCSVSGGIRVRNG
ncbi:MAG: PQQ-dependent sugar dehydrogenase [Ilumatobacteraceae bacterium]